MRAIGWSVIVIMVLVGCSSTLPPLKSNLPVNKSKSVENTECCPVNESDAESDSNESEQEISDLKRFSQNIAPYVEKNWIDKKELFGIQNNFEKFYFLPWSYTTPPMSAEDASWPIQSIRGGYGSNLSPIPPEWFQQMQSQSNFCAFGTLNQKAITLRWMDIRALPTDKPLYKKPSLPGEGYPFDQLQNSSVNYHEPIFVSHTSKDGAWSYVFTNNASGWVKSDGIAIIDDTTIHTFQASEKVFITQDNIPMYDKQGKFRVYSRIGMVLPLDGIEEEYYKVRVWDRNGSLTFLRIPKKSAHIGIQKLNKNDLIGLGNEMLRNTYGWGGMLGERDCSSMIRDMYTPFGIWLPRNSAAQARKGDVIAFSGLSDNEKLALIKEKGVPFETILYLKGHVVLYLGMYENTVMIMHNIWGIRTINALGEKGRHIIGKAVISTLELGAELEDYDARNKLLTRVQSMNIFTKPAALCIARKKYPKILTANP